MLDREADLLTVTDLKQYDFCARVFFYEHCLPQFRPRTYKMDAGLEAHERESKLETRRTLGRFGLSEGKRLFDVRLQSSKLNIHGTIDEVIVASPSEVYPVDYKLARQTSHHYRLQLTAYALMLEEMYETEVNLGYLYLIPARRVEKISITTSLRAQLHNAIQEMRNIILYEHMPPATKQHRKCVSCEFRRICNDV